MTSVFVVSFFDYDGKSLSSETVTITPRNTATVEFMGDTSNGIRAEIAPQDDGKFLVTGEIVGPSGDLIGVYILDTQS